MKVRLKEFMPYIIAMIIMFIFMIFTSFIYTNFMNETLLTSVYDAVRANATSDVVEIASEVNKRKNNNMKNPGADPVVTITRTYTMNNFDFFIGQESVVEGTTNIQPYIYAYLGNNNQYLKLNLTEVLSKIEALQKIDEATGVCSNTGSLYYRHNTGSISGVFEVVENSAVTNAKVKSELQSVLEGGTDSYAFVASFGNNSIPLDDYYFGFSPICKMPVYQANTSSIEEVNLYLFRVYLRGPFDLRVKQADNLNLIYRSILTLSFVIILIDLGLTVLRGNRLFSIRRHQASRRGIAVIKVNKHGRVKYFGRGRDTFGIEVSNFDLFKPVEGGSFGEALRHNSRFIAGYHLDDGEEAFAEFVAVPQYSGYVIIANIVTDEYKKQVQLRDLTEKNSITRLPNRNSLLKNFESMKSEFLNKQVTLAMIKLVEFEQVSKTLGYTAGDALLNNSVKIIADNLKNGYLYQDNNDTLMVLLIDTYQKNDETLQKYLGLFTRPVDLIKSTVGVHLKIGVYELKNVLNTSFDLNDALRKTAIALNRASQQVSTSLVKYDSNLEIYVKYHEQMEEDMHYAIDHDEFVMYYQPQYSLKHNRIEGFESLIRWHNPKYKGVSPQEYIELAEKNGDIVEIGRIINRSVFKAAKSFEPYHVHLSVNVSPAQLMQAGFIDELLTEYRRNELKPGSVCVEITETYLMQNYDLMISKLNILKSNGFSIHLDDFGTGYSSMLYLKELPIDIIKTDMEFIKNLASDEASRIIESEIIKLAKSLHLEVISEGVETTVQVEYLKKFGADYIQGYLVSRAVPFEDAIELVKNGFELKYDEEGGNE